LTLEGRVALVTGGARRVGRAICLELAKAGCDVAIHFRNSRAEAEELAERLAVLGRRATTVGGDLLDRASPPTIVRQVVDRLGRLDVLVNNASAFLTDRPDSVEAFDELQWEHMWRIHVVAPMALCHHARSFLAADAGGCVINLCDITAECPAANHLAYGVSKAGLVALTRGLARALAPDIRVNGVAPGIAVFPEEYSDELRQRLTARVPLAREGTPAEVARAVRFLAESGDYITGQVLAIDGGRSIA